MPHELFAFMSAGFIELCSRSLCDFVIHHMTPMFLKTVAETAMSSRNMTQCTADCL
jgi:hypothetical protein